MCRPLDEKQARVPSKQLAACCQGSRQGGREGWGRGLRRHRRPRVPEICLAPDRSQTGGVAPSAPAPPAWGSRPPWGYPPQTPRTDQNTSMVRGLGPSLLPNGREVNSGAGSLSPCVYREALPSLTVLMGRSAGGFGRSLERPCKWSAVLSAV